MIATKIQIRFGDIDGLGHINNVNLQHYFDLGKSDLFMQVLGVTRKLFTKDAFAQASTSTSYIRPSFIEDELIVESQIERIGNRSITVFQTLKDTKTNTIKAESRSVMVSFDVANQCSADMPQTWREAIENEIEKNN